MPAITSAKIRHLGQDAAGRAQQRHRHHRAGALAEPQAEIEIGRGIERAEQQVVTALGGAVRKHAIVARCGLQPHRDQCCRRGDEAVDDHRAAALGAGKHSAGHHRDLIAAEFAQNVERRCRIAARGGAFGDRELARDPGGIEPGTGADAVGERCRREPVHQQRRRRRIADAHFADCHHVGTISDRGRDDRRAARQAVARLLRRQRRLARRVTAAAPDLGIDQSRMRCDVGIDAGIDHLHLDVREPARAH